MNILVLGCEGQLGTDICKIIKSQDLMSTNLSHNDLDITDTNAIKTIFAQLDVNREWIVINCTGYCNVVEAEGAGRFDAYNVNSIGVAYIANECDKYGAKLIHFSTDYVYSGTSQFPNVECGYTNPLNHYGKSKLMGEQLIENNCDNYTIIRTNSLYGHKPTRTKGNFPSNMLKMYNAGYSINIADNIISTPTYTVELAEATLDVIFAENVPNIINISNKGECSWYDFALEVFKQNNISDAKIVPVKAITTETPQRPLYTVLDCSRYNSLNLYKMSHWKDAFTNYLKEVNDEKKINKI